MKAFRPLLAILLTIFICLQNASTAELGSIPGEIQFAGALSASDTTVSVRFSLFADQANSTALWLETHNVAVSDSGSYSVLLGSETPGGIPQSIFASGEARWLEVSYADSLGTLVTQPRVLLVSVPYAMKAGDAETLGGLPASAFLLNPNMLADRVGDAGGLPGATITDVLPSAAVTAGRIAKFTDGAGATGDSIMTESAGRIGVNNVSPAETLDVDGSLRLSNHGQLKFHATGDPSVRFQMGVSGAGGMQFQSLDGVTPRRFFLVSSTGIAFFQEELENGNITTFGKIGAGTAPLNTMDAAGNMAIGTYAGANAAPAAGLIVSGNVGIGTATPTQKLHVVGNILTSGTVTASSFSGSGASLTGIPLLNVLNDFTAPLVINTSNSTALLAKSTASNALTVYGWATSPTGNAIGGYFQSDSNTDGKGVYGIATAATGSTVGGFFQNSSTSGIAVRGLATAATGGAIGGNFSTQSASGRGVVGSALAATGVGIGGSFDSASSSGYGVVGSADSPTGATFGGRFNSASNSGTAAYGNAYAATGFTVGVLGEVASTNGTAVKGLATSTTGNSIGGYFQTSSSTGNGVFAAASATTGTATTGYFTNASTSGTAIHGWASATSGFTYAGKFTNFSSDGYGIYSAVVSPTGSPTAGYFENQSAGGSGIVATVTATSGFTNGVIGNSASADGKGVSGSATSVSGLTIGVSGNSASPSGTGVRGAGGLYGVYGDTASATGAAVYGKNDGGGYGGRFVSQSQTGTGVFGEATNANGVNYGVYGSALSQTGFAGYFAGKVTVTGTLSKGAGTFKIDHPLDPANKYLYHSFVESPDMMNIYNGNVTTDASGAAVVTMPDYFEALNRDFRYQLTVIGQFAQAIVAEEINNCRFTIRTDKPGVKVSWQVTGVRQDPYAEAHRIQVEEDKPAEERGYYLHPVEYGQPKEKGLESLHRPSSAAVTENAAQLVTTVRR